VAPKIVEDVSDRSPDLERRLQRAGVKAVVEDASFSREEPVESLREPNGEGLHTSRQQPFAGRFDQQVDVIRLYRVVNDARISNPPQRQSFPHDAKGAPAPQAR
jgi:hypothetical protein